MIEPSIAVPHVQLTDSPLFDILALAFPPLLGLKLTNPVVTGYWLFLLKYTKSRLVLWRYCWSLAGHNVECRRNDRKWTEKPIGRICWLPSRPDFLLYV